MWPALNRISGLCYFRLFPIFLTTNLKCTVQSFAESLQHECSKPTQNVMIELYCCGPGLLFWLLLFQIRKGLGSWVFKVLLQRFCKTLYSQFSKTCNSQNFYYTVITSDLNQIPIMWLPVLLSLTIQSCI